MVPELIDTGVLTEIDWSTLEMACTAYGMYREAEDAIYHVTDEEGSRKKRSLAEYVGSKSSHSIPLISIMQKAYDQYFKYASSLGLNPVSRDRIEVKEPKGEEIDLMERLLDEL